MRLSQWRTSAPVRDVLGPKVTAVVEPILAALGAEGDPHAWVVWGEDPHYRYVILVPTADGVVVCHVRMNVPGEGPRVNAKLVRWSRTQLGELGLETQGGHRLATFQVEGQVLRGADAAADEVATFARTLFAGVDGRVPPKPPEGPRRTTKAAAPAKRLPAPAPAAADKPARPATRRPRTA